METETVQQFIVFFTVVAGLGSALSPFINMILEAIKPMNLIPTNYLPFVALMIGLITALIIGVFAPQFGDLLTFGLAGLIGGGISMGTYNKIADSVYNKRKDDK